jgi:hypothetical protein
MADKPDFANRQPWLEHTEAASDFADRKSSYEHRRRLRRTRRRAGRRSRFYGVSQTQR